MRSKMPWIAVMGQDGSGKSTVLNALEVIFAPPVTAGVMLVHLRTGTVFKARVYKGIPHYSRPMHIPFLSVLKLAALALEWLVGYWTVVMRQRAQGGLVIHDRHYLMDILVDPRRYRYAGPLWLVRWVEQVMPRPTAIILLDAPAEVLQQRKKEIPVEESARQRQAYLELIRDRPHSHVVDCSRPLEQVVADVARIIRQYLPGSQTDAPNSADEGRGALEAG
jgi:thymidylate kinase